ncbi:helix-turn-helix transcriptional regulator [Microbacterium tumbae]
MNRLLSPREAADLLGISERQLTLMRFNGRGPVHIKVSHKAVRYRESDVTEWVESRVRQQSSRVAS